MSLSKKQFFLALLALLAIPLSASAVAIEHDELIFTYASEDGELDLDCKHNLTDPARDVWTIWCGMNTPDQRELNVEFAVRAINRPAIPRQSMQLIFSVTNVKGRKPEKLSSQNAWISFNNKSDMNSLHLVSALPADKALVHVYYYPKRGVN